MSIGKKQSGFSVFELILVVVFVAAIGLIGWSVYERRQSANLADSTTNDAKPTPKTSANNVSKAPEINSTDDLDKALETLDQNDPSSTNSDDSKQLDSTSSTF